MAKPTFFFFNDTATTEIYTLSLHDALPICTSFPRQSPGSTRRSPNTCARSSRSEEHTSELQSHSDLVCRLLLEKKRAIKRGRTLGGLMFSCRRRCGHLTPKRDCSS